MTDKRIWRTTCPFCGKRVTVGACNRIYKHNAPSGAYCVKGHGIKLVKLQSSLPQHRERERHGT